MPLRSGGAGCSSSCRLVGGGANAVAAAAAARAHASSPAPHRRAALWLCRASSAEAAEPSGSGGEDDAYYDGLSDAQLKDADYARYAARRKRRVEERDAARLTEEERARRAKIGEANKGRVPWNKGRKHSPGERAPLLCFAASFAASPRAWVGRSMRPKAVAGRGLQSVWCA